MEFDILDALDDLGESISSLNVIGNEQRCHAVKEDKFACLRYCGLLKSDNEIEEAIAKGTQSIEFTQLVEWLSKELQTLNNMESCINAISDPEDASSFLMEVRSFLRELCCPYKCLMDGSITERLLDIQSRKTLLDFLSTELMAARLVNAKKEKVQNILEIEVEDSSTAVSLCSALRTLNVSEDKIRMKPDSCLSEIENKVKAVLAKNSQDVPPPIISEKLSDDQWNMLNTLYDDFFADYTVRRKLLLTRLDVTLLSFTWGEGSKGKETEILEAYLPRYKKLKPKPAVKLSDIIAAREDLLVVEKTSSAKLVKTTRSALNRVLIPPVPDRGGRPKEQRPPMEMPNWSKRTQASGGVQGDRGGGNFRGKSGKKFRGNPPTDGRQKSGNFDSAGTY